MWNVNLFWPSKLFCWSRLVVLSVLTTAQMLNSGILNVLSRNVSAISAGEDADDDEDEDHLVHAVIPGVPKR